MTVGATLGKSISELKEMGPDEIGWWLAYIKRKSELEKVNRGKGSRPSVRTHKT